jgi:hypothetical protein
MLVHVECKPDEYLLKKLGIKSKNITHHQGKSRVFHALKGKNSLIAMVDEDPGSVKTAFEKSLKLIGEYNGIYHYTDTKSNRILVLKGKLEDWIVEISRSAKIRLDDYSLPETANDLHDVLNDRLENFGRLINDLIKSKNPAILKLKSLLN